MATSTKKRKRPIEIDDLLTLRFVKGATISPDGTLCAFPRGFHVRLPGDGASDTGWSRWVAT